MLMFSEPSYWSGGVDTIANEHRCANDGFVKSPTVAHRVRSGAGEGLNRDVPQFPAEIGVRPYLIRDQFFQEGDRRRLA